MRVGITVLASAFLLGTAPVTLAQNLNLNDNQLLAIAQLGAAKFADSEWQKVPPTELNCINQKLRDRGDSVQSLAQRGIFPGDPLAADIRSQCRSSSALDQSSAQTKIAQTRYAVDGLTLGSQVKSDSAAYREYSCGASDQFDGFTWCQKTRNEKKRSGPFTARYSILHAQDGSVVYINQRQEPSFFARNEVDKDIQRYSREIGESARITRMPHRAGLPDGLIALWGKTTLEPLDQDSIKILAEGKSPKKGLLVDFIGNFARSAKEGLPIYRIGGGAGFLWAASFDQTGRGTLRVTAVDASGLSSLPAQAPNFVPSPPQSENAPALIQTKFSLADATGAAPQLDKAETNRSAHVDTGNADQGAEPTKSAERDSKRDSLDTLLLAQYEAQKASLDAKSSAWKLTAIGLFVLLVIAALRRSVKSRKATRGTEQPSEASAAPLATQAQSTGKSERPPNASDDQGDLFNQVSETHSELSSSDLPPAVSESVVPENAAQNDGERREATKPSKSFDEGAFISQLAQTIGAQEPAGALSDLPSALSESVVPENAEKNHGNHEIDSTEQPQSSVRPEQDEVAQRS